MAIDLTTKFFLSLPKTIGQCLKCFWTMFKNFDHEISITIIRDQKISIAKYSDQKLSIIQVGNWSFQTLPKKKLVMNQNFKTLPKNNWAPTKMFWASKKKILPLDQWRLLIEQLKFYGKLTIFFGSRLRNSVINYGNQKLVIKIF